MFVDDYLSVFVDDCLPLSVPQRTDSDQECLFGEVLKIERRKVGVCCFNGADYSRNVTMFPCQCTADDYEW